MENAEGSLFCEITDVGKVALKSLDYFPRVSYEAILRFSSGFFGSNTFVQERNQGLTSSII